MSANQKDESLGEVKADINYRDLFDLRGNKLLEDKNYFTESIIEFPGH